MNIKLDPIFKRRSIRKFTDQEVSDVDVNDILEAAMAAPSACCMDPWEFIIIRSSDLRKKVADFLPNGKMLNDSPVGIIVCGDIDKAHSNELSFMLQDCSAAIENILLAANLIGLGTCWLGVHPREDRIEDLSKLFSLPSNIIPISVIALGHPKENVAPRTRFSSTAVHFEKW